MLRSLVVLGAILIFFCLALRSHYLSMLLYWWFGNFKPLAWVWWDFSSLQLPTLAAGLLIASGFMRNKAPKLDNPIAGLMIAMLITVIIAEIIGGCIGVKPMSLRYVLILVVILLFTERCLDSSLAIMGLMATLVLSLGYHTGKAGIHAATTGTSLYGVKIPGSSFGDSNAMALSSAILLFFAIPLLQRLTDPLGQELLPRWLANGFFRRVSIFIIIAIMGGSAYLVIATESRGSALALSLGVVLWIALHRNRVRIFVTVVALGTIAFVFVPLSDSYKERISSAFVEQEELDSSAASRPHFWRTAVLMVESNPLGVGAGCFAANYSAFDTTGGQFGRNRSVHSSHFAILAETGWLGLIIWFTLLSKSIHCLWRIRKNSHCRISYCAQARFRFELATALLVAQIIFIFGGSFYTMGFNDLTWIVFVIVIAIERMAKVMPLHTSQNRADG